LTGLGLTGRLRGKTGQKVRGQAPHVDPAPEKCGPIDPLDPVAPRPLVQNSIFTSRNQLFWAL